MKLWAVGAVFQLLGKKRLPRFAHYPYNNVPMIPIQLTKHKEKQSCMKSIYWRCWLPESFR